MDAVLHVIVAGVAGAERQATDGVAQRAVTSPLHRDARCQPGGPVDPNRVEYLGKEQLLKGYVVRAEDERRELRYQPGTERMLSWKADTAGLLPKSSTGLVARP